MALYKEDIVNVELSSGTLYRSFMANAIGEGDAMANRFGVRLFRDNEPVNIGSGECQGFFMAPDGTNILISGSSYTGVDGNKAWVQLPQGCYAYKGPFCLAIKLIGGGVTGTMRIVDGVVSNTGASGAVMPTSQVPTSAEIIAAYEDAVAVIDNSVRFDITQSLTEAEKTKARENIEAASAEKVNWIDNAFKEYETSNIIIVDDSAWNDSASVPAAISAEGYSRCNAPVRYIKNAELVCSEQSLSFIYYNESLEKQGTTSNYNEIPDSAAYFVFSAQATITSAEYRIFAEYIKHCETRIPIIFTQGTVNTSGYDETSATETGDIDSSVTNRVTSQIVYVEEDDLLIVRTAQGYKFVLFFYNDDGTLYGSAGTWGMYYSGKPTTKQVRILVKNNAGTDISTSDGVLNTQISVIPGMYATRGRSETDLNKNYYIGVNERLIADFNFVASNAPLKMFQGLTWEQANISTNPEQDPGEKYSSSIRLCNTTKLNTESYRYLHIEIRDGFVANIHKYTYYNSYMGSTGWLTTNPANVYVGDCQWIYIVIAKSDKTSNIAPSRGNIAIKSLYAMNLPERSLWQGKKWVSYGDSITYNGNWQSYVVNDLGFAHINLGVGGSRVGHYSEDGTEYTDWFGADSRIADIPTDTDVITIMGGTNDFGGNPTPLGPAVYDKETHSFDTHTFQGSLAEVCRKIYARVPSVKIALMSLTGGQFTSEDYDMPQRKNALGYTGLDYANATKEVADLLNLKYIDIWNDGINVFNRSLYISDTVHPNAEGAKLIASKVIFGLKDIAPV